MNLRDPRVYKLKALADIWTGDGSGNAGRLITTGLLGSIRWWFEVLARGLGGCACDPSNTGSRCPDRQGRRCVVCELFGCTGWARKFRFDVLDSDRHAQQNQIKKGETFHLVFTPLRPIGREEWALLDATIRFIADYAAIGGKTVYKPSDQSARQDLDHHHDYGIVSVEEPGDANAVSLEALQAYVGEKRWRRVNHGDFAWASLENFWCVSGRYLARQNASASTFNMVIGRPEPKSNDGQNDTWLAGRRPRKAQGRRPKVPPESKKVFSFKAPPRTFGFTNGNHISLDTVKTRLREAWDDLGDTDVRTGDAILETLLGGATP